MNDDSLRSRGLFGRLGLLVGALASAVGTVRQGGPAVQVRMRHATSRYTKSRVDRAKRKTRNRMARLSRRINRANGSYRRATA